MLQLQKKNGEKTPRQTSIEMYGACFAKDATTNEIIGKCENLIAKYTKWQKNLEELKAEKEKEAKSFQEKIKELAERLNALSEDERDRFFEFYKHSATTPKEQKE